MYPHYFTEDQFNSYLRCIRNIEVGDKIEFYINVDGYHTSVKSSYTEFALVSSVVKNPQKVIQSYGFDYIVYSGLYDNTKHSIPLIIFETKHFSKGRFWKAIDWNPLYKKYLPDPEAYYGSIRQEMLVKSIIKNTK